VRALYSILVLVVVLNDEETYGPLEGCTIVEVRADYLDEHDLYEGDGRFIAAFAPEAPYVEFDEEIPDGDDIFIVVLADGDTFSEARGCLVVEVGDDYVGVDPAADGTQLAEL
jgi:hypothetical protein